MKAEELVLNIFNDFFLNNPGLYDIWVWHMVVTLLK